MLDKDYNLRGADPKVLNFKKVYMITHRCSGLWISKFALWKLFRYLINCAGVTRQNRDFVEIDFVKSLPFYYFKDMKLEEYFYLIG